MPSNIRRTGVGRRSFEKDVEAIRVASNTYGGGGVGTDHGSLTGLADDDHSQYAHLSQNESIVGQWQYAPGSPQAPFTLSANAQGQKVVGLNADELDSLDSSADPGATAAILKTDTSGILILEQLDVTVVGSDLIPLTVDTYDLGSSSKLWRKGYLSELEALLFVENSIHVEGGWLIVGHDQGTLDEDVNDTQTTIDFGKTMTVGDFVLLRGYLQVEYMEIGTLVSGTTYNVDEVGVDGARDLDGSGKNPWPQGAVFLVLGNTGDGRIELVANQTDAPRISILEQGATYNAQNERVRIGNMRGSYGVGSNDYYGFGAGDYSGGNYLKYNPTDGFILTGGDGAVRIDDAGVAVAAGTVYDPEGPTEITFYEGTGFSVVGSGLEAIIDIPNFNSLRIYCNDHTDGVGIVGYIDVGSNTTVGASWFSTQVDNVFLYGGVNVGTTAGWDPTTGHLGVQYDARIGQGLMVGTLTVDAYNDDIVCTGGIHAGATGTNPAVGDIRCTSGLSVGSVTIGMGVGQGYFSDTVYINDTANSKSTKGLTVKTTDTSETFSSKGDGVHAFTANTEADTHFTIGPVSDSDGGVFLTGYGGSTLGLVLQGAAEVENSARSTSGTAMIRTNSWKWNGTTGTTNPSADVNIFAWRSGSNTRMILDANGNLHLDGSSNNGVWDEYDDIKLLTVARISQLSPEHVLRERFSDWIDYARPILEATNVVTVNDGQYGNDNDGSTFINVNNMLMLHSDAIRQVYSNLMEEITFLKGKVLQLEARNENHN